jgi:hypothetical protein
VDRCRRGWTCIIVERSRCVAVVIRSVAVTKRTDYYDVFSHAFDYIALGILIACMLGVGAKSLHKSR